MFGIFQADIPIGNRLWIALLAMIVASAFIPGSLDVFYTEPVAFAISFLFIYGQAALFAVVLTSPFSFVPAVANVVRMFRRARPGDNFYYDAETRDTGGGGFQTLVFLLAFVGSVVWIADGNSSGELGTIGLILVLLVEVNYEMQRGARHSQYEYAEITRTGDQLPIAVTLERSGLEKRYEIGDRWSKIVAFLGNNNWEFMALSENCAFVRRPLRKDMILERALEFLLKKW